VNHFVENWMSEFLSFWGNSVKFSRFIVSMFFGVIYCTLKLHSWLSIDHNDTHIMAGLTVTGWLSVHQRNAMLANRMLFVKNMLLKKISSSRQTSLIVIYGHTNSILPKCYGIVWFTWRTIFDTHPKATHCINLQLSKWCLQTKFQSVTQVIQVISGLPVVQNLILCAFLRL